MGTHTILSASVKFPDATVRVHSPLFAVFAKTGVPVNVSLCRVVELLQVASNMYVTGAFPVEFGAVTTSLMDAVIVPPT